MAQSWCKVASNLDSHPKIRMAGRLGREVFLYALRRNAEPDNETPGRIGKAYLADWYLSDVLMMTRDEAVTGVTSLVTAGLLREEDDFFVIVSWKEGWGKDNGAGAERTRRWRENKKLAQRDVTCDGRDVTNVTRDACDTDQKRSEEARSEEEKNSAAPTARGSRSRKPKKPDWTQAEIASAEFVLEKLGAQNGVRYSGTADHLRLIINLLRRGVSEVDLRAIVGYCAIELEWKDKPEMRTYLRPETLFGPQTHSKYLDPARQWLESLPPDQRPQLRGDAQGEP